jgi:hypothetical protein
MQKGSLLCLACQSSQQPQHKEPKPHSTFIFNALKSCWNGNNYFPLINFSTCYEMTFIDNHAHPWKKCSHYQDFIYIGCSVCQSFPSCKNHLNLSQYQRPQTTKTSSDMLNYIFGGHFTLFTFFKITKFSITVTGCIHSLILWFIRTEWEVLAYLERISLAGTAFSCVLKIDVLCSSNLNCVFMSRESCMNSL